MKSNFNERREARKESYKALSDKNNSESENRYRNAKELGNMIPFGQPILVGHHSEKRHRAHLDKIDNNMRKSVEATNKAKYYEDKAKAMDNDNSIYSDDPETLLKLREKLQSLEAAQEQMKTVNKLCRSKKFTQEEKVSILKDLNYRESSIHALLNPTYSYEKPGFQSWALSNNNANIRRVKERIKSMERTANDTTQTFTIGEVEIIDNVEDNRVQVYFPAIPDEEIRKSLKQNGFRWARSIGAWQRHRSPYALDQAKKIVGLGC